MIPRVVVVTGASGFTGPFVVRALKARFPEARVRCFVRLTSRRNSLDGLPLEFAVGDLRDVPSLRAAFKGADTLVHVASLGFDWIDPLFAAVKGSSLERGVFLGTTAILTTLPVASRPIRERAEALVRASGLAWTILRPTMIYGTPEDRNIARLIRFVLRWPVIPIVAPDARQQPVHVEDVAAAVAAVLESPATIGQTYNIAGREPIALEKLVRAVAAAAGVRRALLRIPLPVVRTAVALYGRLSAHPGIRVEQIDRLHEDKAFDFGAAARDFGFSPRSFDVGVRSEVALMRVNKAGAAV